MIYLAYDGSLNGDWVARYALRLALHGGKSLTVLHGLDGSRPVEEIESAFDRMVYDGSLLGVEVRTQLLEVEKNILHTLLHAIHPGHESLVVCGTRVRSRRHAFLAGTLAEKLLHGHRFSTLALRVVQPGLLGAPRDLLLPLTGHPREIEPLIPFYRLLAPDLDRVEIIRGSVVSSLRLRHLSEEQSAILHAEGARSLEEIFSSLRSLGDCRLDGHALICDDWEHEIAIQASRLKTRLILVGARARTLPHRLILANPLERLLRNTTCDVAIYRAP